MNAGKKTVAPADVFKALDDVEFSFLKGPLEAEFASTSSAVGTKFAPAGQTTCSPVAKLCPVWLTGRRVQPDPDGETHKLPPESACQARRRRGRRHGDGGHDGGGCDGGWCAAREEGAC